jgi:hypothetical protein
MRVIDNKSRVTGNGKSITQQVTYSNGRNETKVTVQRDRQGGSPRVTGIEKKIK